MRSVNDAASWTAMVAHEPSGISTSENIPLIYPGPFPQYRQQEAAKEEAEKIDELKEPQGWQRR